MALRGIRGATTVTSNTKAEVIAATKELLTALVRARMVLRDIAPNCSAMADINEAIAKATGGQS